MPNMETTITTALRTAADYYKVCAAEYRSKGMERTAIQFETQSQDATKLAVNIEANGLARVIQREATP